MAQLACDRDMAWFDANPRATWRVRPALKGEAVIIDGWCAVEPATRGYVIAIHHACARDRRAAFARGIYPLIVHLTDREKARTILAGEGARMAKWFKRHGESSPPSKGTAMLAEGML